jgi:hypothetical protein
MSEDRGTMGHLTNYVTLVSLTLLALNLLVLGFWRSTIQLEYDKP